MLRCLEIEFLSLSASCITVSSICAAPFTNMCSTQADYNLGNRGSVAVASFLGVPSALISGTQFPLKATGPRYSAVSDALSRLLTA
jgi:hypothetical protein